MNISYNWLKDLIDISLSPDELALALTRVGLAVEGVHPHGDDFVLDVDLTSNRPDCLSHLGVARELSVITKAETRPVGSVSLLSASVTDATQRLVTIEGSDICHRFTARIIRNVKIGPSPEWLVKRLEAVGERSINNVADITNFVMHELGQPMHSFDLDKLAENRIVVRRARPGETVKTLDEVDRKLDGSMLAICDADKPVSIGGVMGGLDSGITEQTTNVLLEVAYFRRESIRQTSRKLNLATEASYRFERGVDIENIVRASNRATKLICELAGGEAGEFADVYPTKFVPNQVESNDISSAVKRLTGLNVEANECVRILNALGIRENESDIQNLRSKHFLAPSWRYDIAIEEDLVEEIARHTGYENIKDELPPAYGAGEYQGTEVREKLLRQTLVDLGFDETISYSFIDTKNDAVFETLPGLVDEELEEQFVTLQDSVIEGAVRMRPSILPGLLDAVRLNLNYQRRDVKVFELGKVFAAATSETNLPAETELFSLVITGGEICENKAMPVRLLDFYDAKGAVEAALDAAGITNLSFAPADVKHLRRGQSAALSSNGKTIGYVGRLNEEIAANYKFKQPVYVAEIDLDGALAVDSARPAYRSLPKYPGISRDVSFVAKRTVAYEEIRKTVVDQNAELCRNVQFVDVYEGKGLADDERSITIRFEYRSDERTLLESEIEAVHNTIVRSVENTLGIKQRF